MNTPTNPTRAEQWAYDGEGHVVARHILYDGDLVDSLYLAGLEEITTRSTGTSTMVLLAWGGGGARWAVRTYGTLTYLIRDHLSSVVVGLDTTGNPTVSRLYDVRGIPRYFSVDGFTDSLLGEEGYGGQPSDNGVSALGMMGARQYEGDLSQFTSADSVQDGLNRYAYAHDNPETDTDPSGHRASGCTLEDGTWYCRTETQGPPPAPDPKPCVAPTPTQPQCNSKPPQSNGTGGNSGSGGGSPTASQIQQARDDAGAAVDQFHGLEDKLQTILDAVEWISDRFPFPIPEALEGFKKGLTLSVSEIQGIEYLYKGQKA